MCNVVVKQGVLQSQNARGQILTSPLVNHVTRGKLHNRCVSQFPHISKTGAIIVSINISEDCGEEELIYVNCLAWYLAHNKHLYKVLTIVTVSNSYTCGQNHKKD